MTPNLSPKPDVQYAEAPVSWNTRYIHPDRFECQLTLRGETGQEVLEKAQSAIAYLLKNGCAPAVSAKNGFHAQDNHNSQPQSNGSDNGSHERSWCPTHQCEMKKWDKDGRVWYSHKVDGQWCNGKAKGK